MSNGVCGQPTARSNVDRWQLCRFTASGKHYWTLICLLQHVDYFIAEDVFGTVQVGKNFTSDPRNFTGWSLRQVMELPFVYSPGLKSFPEEPEIVRALCLFALAIIAAISGIDL